MENLFKFLGTDKLLSFFLIISFLTGLSMFYVALKFDQQKSMKKLDFEIQAIELGYAVYSTGVFQWKK